MAIMIKAVNSVWSQALGAHQITDEVEHGTPYSGIGPAVFRRNSRYHIHSNFRMTTKIVDW